MLTQTRDLDYRFEEFRRIRQAERSFEMVGRVLVVGICVASFFGLRDIVGGSRGISAAILPATIALVAGVLISRGWHALLQVTPLSAHRDKRARLLGYAALLTLVCLAFSAWPVATVIGGGAAISAHMNRYLVTAATAVSNSGKRVDAQKGVIEEASRIGGEFNEHANREQGSGAVGGGARGEGPVFLTLAAISSFWSDIIQDQERAVRSADEARADARTLLLAMQQVAADSAAALDERQMRFAALATRLSAEVERISRTNLATAINGGPANLGHRTALTPAAKAIREALEASRVRLLDLRKRADKLQQSDEIRLAPYQSINPGNAVRLYIEETLPAWTMAVSLDVVPILLLCILIAMYQSARLVSRLNGTWGGFDEQLGDTPPIRADDSAPSAGP